SFSVLQQALSLLAPHGQHMQVGLLPGTVPADKVHLGPLIARELEVIGCHGIPRTSYADLFEFLDRHKIDPAVLINQKVDLQHAIEPFVNQPKLDFQGAMCITPEA
nr:hypothetical protein [Saprospiraceae bacterium]